MTFVLNSHIKSLDGMFDDPKIQIVKFSNVKGFLVYTHESAIMIDTGHSKTTNQIEAAFKTVNLDISKLKIIILTHTHFDHAGGANALKRLSGAKLAVHKNEADNLRKGFTPFPRGTRWKARLLVSIGSVFARKMAWYPEAEPDILIDESLDLHSFGIPGEVIHTPGHTLGSVSIFLDNGIVFGGDNVMGISNKVHYPPFANDPAQVIKVWEFYIRKGIKGVYPAHGEFVPIEVIKAELEEARLKHA